MLAAKNVDMSTVLIVDDRPANRALLLTLLGYEGHRLLEAGDGAQALAIARAEHPDLIISDILMPTMDGYEFVRRLRAEPDIADTAVMFYTAHYHGAEARNLAKACGVRHILTKPCEPEVILRTVKLALGSPVAPSKPKAQKFNEEHLRLITDKLSDTTDELTLANERLAALIEINLQLALEREPPQLLEKVCRAARELIGAKYALLAIGNKDDANTSYVATAGMDSATANGLDRLVLQEGVMGAVFTERKPRRVTNPGGDPRRVGLPSQHPPVYAILVAPLVSLLNVYGWICLADKLGAKEFSAEDEWLLTIHAAQVGRIYENGRLYAELQRQMARLDVEVADHKRAAKELRESEQRFRQLAENIREVFFLTDPTNTHILYISPAYEEIWGRSCESLYAQPQSWEDSIHPEDREAVRQGNEARDATGRLDYEYRIVRPDGTQRWIRARGFPIRDDRGEIYRIAGVAEDVTERRQADEARSRLIAILDATTDFVTISDAEGRVLYMNAANRRLFGIGPNANISQRMLTDNHADGARMLILQEGVPTATSHGVWSGETALVNRDGHEVPVSQLIIAHKSHAGEVRFLSSIARNISERKHLEKQLIYEASHDSLTKLPNRALFYDRLQQALGYAQRHNNRVAVLFMDLDRFKRINDTLGHHIGDRFLCAVAERLGDCVRATDTLARHGGDEFSIILSELTDVKDISSVLQKIRVAFAQPFAVENEELFTTFSIGIAVYPDDGKDATTLLKNADIAMYRAKQYGRNIHRFYAPEMNIGGHELLSLETDLRRALDRQEFLLHYQPQVSLRTGRITGVEALIRWQHPDKGLIPPADFIPLLEETGLIVPVGEWVLQNACAQARAWQASGLVPVRIAVNLSGRQFHDPAIVDTIKRIVSDEKISPGRIEIEITESTIMQNAAVITDMLKVLHATGIRLAIDDFGTGYSSLSYLRYFLVDTLKIDNSFMRDTPTHPDAAAIVSAIISLGHTLKLSVIAEGVERSDQLEFLRQHGCDEYQGYLFSRPVPPNTLAALLRNTM